jgi:hypothetical protein
VEVNNDVNNVVNMPLHLPDGSVKSEIGKSDGRDEHDFHRLDRLSHIVQGQIKYPVLE